MATGTRKRTSPTKEERAPGPGGNGANARAPLRERGQALRKSLDEVVADIDDVLEKNAEEFVKEYVQRGGQ